MAVAYATALDEVAQDGQGRNSPFTAALLKRLQEPGLEIEMCSAASPPTSMPRQAAANVLKSTSRCYRNITSTLARGTGNRSRELTG